MKVPSDHYKGPNVTSKGHTPLLIPVPPWENVNKTMNLKSAIMVTWFIKLKLARFEIQGCPTVIWSLIQTLTLTHNELLASLGVWIVLLQMSKTLGPDRLWGILSSTKTNKNQNDIHGTVSQILSSQSHSPPPSISQWHQRVLRPRSEYLHRWETPGQHHGWTHTGPGWVTG